MVHSKPPSFILGYHGCDRGIAEAIFAGDADLVSSANSYDWLGHGIYFWEDDPLRAISWAKSNPSINEPYVVGAIIDLENCLSLMREDHLELLKKSHDHLTKTYEISGNPLPKKFIR